jgi:hypothetical protein
LLVTAVVVLACFWQTGCVRRRMTIRSNPPGAEVYVDDYPIGKTPVSAPFTFYGTRKLRLVRDGYETLNVKQRFPAPWYQYVPIDLIADNFWPWEVRDERVVDLQMEPQKIVPTDQLLTRAENLRRGTRAGYVSPLPNAPPVPTSPPVAPPAPQPSRVPPTYPPPGYPPPGYPPPGYPPPSTAPAIQNPPLNRLPLPDINDVPEAVPPGYPSGGQPGTTGWRSPATR